MNQIPSGLYIPVDFLSVDIITAYLLDYRRADTVLLSYLDVSSSSVASILMGTGGKAPAIDVRIACVSNTRSLSRVVLLSCENLLCHRHRTETAREWRVIPSQLLPSVTQIGRHLRLYRALHTLR